MQTPLFEQVTASLDDPFVSFECVGTKPMADVHQYACLFVQQWLNKKSLWLVGTRTRTEEGSYVLTDVKEFKHSEDRARYELDQRSSSNALGRPDA